MNLDLDGHENDILYSQPTKNLHCDQGIELNIVMLLSYFCLKKQNVTYNINRLCCAHLKLKESNPLHITIPVFKPKRMLITVYGIPFHLPTGKTQAH